MTVDLDGLSASGRGPWRTFDARQPVFSLHVPKCAGQSMRRILEGWFGPGFRPHYFQQNAAPPPVHETGPGICVHGHFNHERGWGIDQYYPDAEQLVTVLRDPLEVMVSNYFYWKKRHAHIVPEARQYRSISEFFEERSRAPILPFLPAGIDESNFRDVLARRFIWIGLVENLSSSLPHLARILGNPRPAIPRVNASSRDETLPEAAARRFAATHRLEYAIYDWVKAAWDAFPPT